MAEAKKTSQDTGPSGFVGNETGQGIVWSASEFIAHEKSAGWYFWLSLATIAVAVLVFIVTRDYLSVGVVIVAGLLLGVYGSHKPRQLEYRIDGSGISIGGKYHGYDEYKSFSVAQEGAFAGFTLMPLKRFAAPITIYYSPDDEEQILDALSAQLPLEEHQPDIIDKLTHKLRF